MNSITFQDFLAPDKCGICNEDVGVKRNVLGKSDEPSFCHPGSLSGNFCKLFHDKCFMKHLDGSFAELCFREDKERLDPSMVSSASFNKAGKVFEKTFKCPHCEEEIESVNFSISKTTFWGPDRAKYLTLPAEEFLREKYLTLPAEEFLREWVPSFFLTHAAITGDIRLIRAYLEKNKPSESLAKNLVLRALGFGHTAIAREVVQSVPKSTATLQTAVNVCGIKGYIDLLQDLIPERRVLTLPSELRGPVIEYAANNGHLNIIKYLLPTLYDMEVGEAGLTQETRGKALVAAIKLHGNPAFVEALLPFRWPWSTENPISQEHCDEAALAAVQYVGKNAIITNKGLLLSSTYHVGYSILKILLQRVSITNEARGKAYYQNAILHGAEGLLAAEVLWSNSSIEAALFDKVRKESPHICQRELASELYHYAHSKDTVMGVLKFIASPYYYLTSGSSTNNQPASTSQTSSLPTGAPPSALPESSSASSSVLTSPPTNAFSSTELVAKSPSYVVDHSDKDNVLQPSIIAPFQLPPPATTTTTSFSNISSSSTIIEESFPMTIAAPKEDRTTSTSSKSHIPKHIASSLPVISNASVGEEVQVVKSTRQQKEMQDYEKASLKDRVTVANEFEIDKMMEEDSFCSFDLSFENWSNWDILKVGLFAIALMATSGAGYAYYTYQVIDPLVIGPAVIAFLSLVSSIAIHFLVGEEESLAIV